MADDVQREVVTTLELGRRTVEVSVCRRPDGDSWCELGTRWSRTDGRQISDTSRLRPRQIDAVVRALQSAKARLEQQARRAEP